MNPSSNPNPGTARQAVSRERAPENRAQTPEPTPNKLTAASLVNSRAPFRLQVERIAGRFAPQPPQSARKFVGRSPGSRKSLMVNRKIKAQPATHPRL